MECNLSEFFKNVFFFFVKALYSIIRVSLMTRSHLKTTVSETMNWCHVLQFAMALKGSAWAGLKPVFSDSSSGKS
jgi:hypothetical protein